MKKPVDKELSREVSLEACSSSRVLIVLEPCSLHDLGNACVALEVFGLRRVENWNCLQDEANFTAYSHCEGSGGFIDALCHWRDLFLVLSEVMRRFLQSPCAVQVTREQSSRHATATP